MKGVAVASSPPRIEPPVNAGELEEPEAVSAQPPAVPEAPALPAAEPDDMADALAGGAPPAVQYEPAPAVPAIPTDVERVVPIAQPSFPSWRTLARWLLVLIALYAIGWLLWSALPAMTPFIIGLVLAYLLLPLVNRLDRWMPRSLAILTVYAGGVVLVAISIAYVVPPVVDQVQQLIASIPSADRIVELWNELLQSYRNLVPPNIRQPIDDGIRNALRTAQANLAGYVQSLGAFVFSQVLSILNTVTFLIGFLIIPIWLYYVLSDEARGRTFVDRILHPRIRPDFWNVWGLVNEVVSDYVRGQLLLGLAVGAMVGAGLLSLRLFGIHVPYILLLAIVAGITELVPIIGPIIGAIPGVLIGFFGGVGGWQAGLAVLAIYIIVQQLENNFLVPRIIGESIGIHPAILTVVLIAMGQVFGLLGVILAAPVSAIARDLFTYTYRRLEGMPAETARRSVAGEADEKQAATTPGS
jgi:predicted PurR-regulated permease PerM